MQGHHGRWVQQLLCLLPDVLSTIAKVLRSPWSGTIYYPVTIKFKKLEGKAGVFRHDWADCEIILSNAPSYGRVHMVATLIHELGHWVDWRAGTIADTPLHRRTGVGEGYDYYNKPTEIRARALASVLLHVMAKDRGTPLELDDSSWFYDVDDKEYELAMEILPLIEEEAREFFELAEEEKERARAYKRGLRISSGVRWRSQEASDYWQEEWEEGRF